MPFYVCNHKVEPQKDPRLRPYDYEETKTYQFNSHLKLDIYPFHFNLGKKLVEIANFMGKEVDEVIEEILKARINELYGENF